MVAEKDWQAILADALGGEGLQILADRLEQLKRECSLSLVPIAKERDLAIGVVQQKVVAAEEEEEKLWDEYAETAQAKRKANGPLFLVTLEEVIGKLHESKKRPACGGGDAGL